LRRLRGFPLRNEKFLSNTAAFFLRSKELPCGPGLRGGVTPKPTGEPMKISAIALTALVLPLVPLAATEYTWISPEPTVWQNGLAWTPIGVPDGSDDDATIAGGLSHAQIEGTTVEIGNLSLDAFGRLSIFAGGELSVFNLLLGIDEPGAVLSVSGFGSSLHVGGSIFMAQNSDADGTLEVSDGASVQVELSIQLGINGSGTIALNNGTLQVPVLSISDTGSVITLEGNSILNAQNLQLLGSADTNPGLVVHAGSAVLIEGDSIFQVATNSFSQSAVLVSGGALTVTNGAAEGNVIIGAGGYGILTVEEGGTFQTGAALVGSDFGSSGRVRITGTNSEWQAGGRVTVGPGGEGELILQDGGVARLEDESNVLQPLILARDGGSQGTLSIGGGLGDAAAAPGTLVASAIEGGDGAAVVRFNHTSSDYVFDTELSGSLDVHVSAGVTTLGGTNTFTGQIVLDGGTLAVGDRFQLGKESNTLVFDGGALRPTAFFLLDHGAELLAGGGTFDSSVLEVAYLGVISGTGGLTITGTGGAVLNPFDTATNTPLANTYSGGTTVIDSRLTVRYDTDLGEASGELHLDNSTLEILLTSSGTFHTNRTVSLSPSGATININTGPDFPLIATFGGTISGNSTLVKTGLGTLELDPDKAYVGILNIQEGAVQASQSGAFGSVNTLTTIAAGAEFLLPASGKVDIGSLTGEGTVFLNGSSLWVHMHDDAVFSGAIADGDTPGGSLVVDQAVAGTSLTLTGEISYTGLTTVNAGTLIVDTIYVETADGAIFVAEGATLGGNGVLRGESTIQGIMAPGTGVGTLTIDNHVTWDGLADNAWTFELAPGGLSDLLVVGGDFLRGSGNDFVFDFLGAGVTGTFTLIEWGGGTNFDASDFTGVNLAPGYYVESFLIDGNSLQVTVVPEPTTAALVASALLCGFLSRRRNRGGR